MAPRSLFWLVAPALLLVACGRTASAPRAVPTRPAPPAIVASHAAPDAPAERACAPWSSIGRGVSVRRCGGGAGHAAVLFAGWRITATSAQAWADALDAARLRALGVSTLYAVEGPAQVDYRGKELAVDALLADLDAGAAGRDAWVLAVAHSSGAHVAASLFDRAFRAGRARSLRGRVVYVDLDGDRGIASDPERALSPQSVAGLRRALFVAVEDRARGLHGFSAAAMQEGHRAFAGASELLVYDASGAGCAVDACAHLALVNTRPEARGNASYARFERGPVNTWWLARAEAWLSASDDAPRADRFEGL